MKYTEEVFLKLWKQSKSDLRKVLSLVRSLLYDREDGIRHINYIQNDLYERHIIPFKVSSEQDYDKIDKYKGNINVVLLLEYFYLANTELKRLRNEIYQAPRI